MVCMCFGSCTVSIFSCPASATLAEQAFFFMSLRSPNPNPIVSKFKLKLSFVYLSCMPASSQFSELLKAHSGRVRAGARNNKLSDQKANDGPSDLQKPTMSSTPSHSSSNTMRPKNASGCPLKTNPALSTSHSNPVVENSVSPMSSRNRRKRSEARRGTKTLKNNLPIQQDSSQRPGRPHSSTHTAPVKDPPPHLVPRNPRTPIPSCDSNKDIDALVERVRAVAMAENRPSTPGSHIDWAGEDDDTLPDLDDWGITAISTTDSKAPAMSPIIISGLKPLPELTPSAAHDGATSAHVALSTSLQPAENSTQVTPTSKGVTEQDRLSQSCEKDKASTPIDDAQDLDTPVNHVLGGLAQSIHAPPVTHADPGKDSLAASIFAPQKIMDSIATPTQLNVLRHGQGRDRNHIVGRPSNRNGRGGSPNHHMRNHASPPTSTHRSSHSRPILTGAAISRLAQVVGNTTAPSSKATITND